jgi:sodium-coupled neutral amino acid transporter 11
LFNVEKIVCGLMGIEGTAVKRAIGLEDQFNADEAAEALLEHEMDTFDINTVPIGVGEEASQYRSTVIDSAFNFTNSIVGAGYFEFIQVIYTKIRDYWYFGIQSGLPYAMNESGLIVGLFMILFVAYLVDQTVIMLVIDGRLSGQTTYQGMVQSCFGKKGFWTVSFFQFVMGYGGMCAYTVILGDAIPAVFRAILPSDTFLYSILTSRSIIILLCTLGVSLPLSLYRDVSALAKTSALSIFMIGFVVLSGRLYFISHCKRT